MLLLSPKIIYLVTLFIATALLTYLSHHHRSSFRSGLVLQQISNKPLAPNDGCVVRTGNEERCLTHPNNVASGSPMPSILSGLVSDPHDHVSLEPKKTSRIVQASMLSGALDTPLFERILATHVDHGERWGYDTQILRRFIRGHGNWEESIFSKPLYVLQLLTREMGKSQEERAEWIVWFDSDTIVLNPNISWELFLPPVEFADIHMLGTHDWNGFNCGVFFVRVHEWSINYFTETAALPLSSPDIDLGYNRDQTAMLLTLGKPIYQQNFLYQPISWYNGFHDSEKRLPQVQPGDILVHFAGVKWRGEGRLEAGIRLWLENVEKEPQRWALQLLDTTYLSEIKEFWSRIGQARQLSRHAISTIQEYNATNPSATNSKHAKTNNATNDDMYNGTHVQMSDVAMRMIKLEKSYTRLQKVVMRESYRSSRMNEAVQNITAALERVEVMNVK